jgi:hypothetical protein
MIYDNFWHGWLRHCATNRKVASSIPEGITGIFRWHNPSGRTMTLESTHPLTEMSTKYIHRGKGGRCKEMTNLLTVQKCGILKFLEAEGPVSCRTGITLPCCTNTPVCLSYAEVAKQSTAKHQSIAAAFFPLYKIICQLNTIKSYSGSTYFYEEIFCQLKITKSRYWSFLKDEQLNTASSFIQLWTSFQ